MTALHEASQKGHHEVVHILLDYGAKVNALDMVRYLISISFFLSF
jgi:ankyrin repeat protein